MIREPIRHLATRWLPLALWLAGSPGFPALAQDNTVRATPIQPPPIPTPGPEVSDTLDTRLRFANMLYNYQKYDGAAEKYVEFLKAVPDSPDAPDAWFRLGDCYRRLNANDQAIKCLDRYLQLAPEGQYAAVAAFSLARIHFNADRFAESIPYWDIASRKLDQPEIQAETLFFHAQALQLAGKIPDAVAAYERLLASKIQHRYREMAELELARLTLSQGDRTRALTHFENLATTSKDAAIVDEARFRAGVLLLETKQPEKAEGFLRQTLESSKDASYKQLAQMALIQQAYSREDHDDVIRLWSLAPLSAEGSAKSQLELMVANSLRQKKNYPQAIRLYGEVERDAKGTPEGTEAGYRKLLCFHEAGDKDLARYVDLFLAAQSAVDASSNYIDLALLLKGETLFQNGDFKGAAEAYRNVRSENVDSKYGPARLYKMGWAMIDSGSEAEGMDALGEFITRHADSPLLPSALMKRAITRHKLEDFEAALEDYRRIAKDFPTSENTEYALTQIALIQRHLRRLEPMVAAYKDLLAKFPKTALRAEALFWIGGGLFDLKQYEASLEPLREARSLNEKAFGETASVRIIFALYRLDQLKPLLEETRAYRTNHGDNPVLQPVYGHLGRAYFDSGEYTIAEPYLVLRSDPAKPKQTPPDIWRKLADIHMSLKKYDTALSDLDHYLLHDQHVENKARAMLDKATCHLRLSALPEAQVAAEEVLRQVRAGRLNSEARVLLGDIFLSQNDPAKAIQYYTIVVEFGADPVMVPLAMSKMVEALEARGDPDKAENYRDRLAAEFPDFRP